MSKCESWCGKSCCMEQGCENRLNYVRDWNRIHGWDTPMGRQHSALIECCEAAEDRQMHRTGVVQYLEWHK